MKLLLYPFTFLFIMSMIGCTKEDVVIDPSIQFNIDKQNIRNYLNQNGLQADSTPEGIFYIVDYTHDTLVKHPTINSTVKVDYKGYLLTGKVFETNYNQSFSLTEVIDGWRFGIPKFKEGERGRLFIPSKLAYGTSSSASIPANSPLIFEVNLIKVN